MYGSIVTQLVTQVTAGLGRSLARAGHSERLGLMAKGSGPKPKGKPARKSSGIAVAALGAAALVIGSLITAMANGHHGWKFWESPSPTAATGVPTPPLTSPQSPTAVEASAKFTTLVDGEVVAHCMALGLTRENIPRGSSVWLTVQVPLSNDEPDPSGIYLANELPPKSFGPLTINPVTIGNHSTVDRPYWLRLYLVDGRHSSAFHEGQRVDTDALKDQRILDEVAVRRAKEGDNATGEADTEDPDSKQCRSSDTR